MQSLRVLNRLVIESAVGEAMRESCLVSTTVGSPPPLAPLPVSPSIRHRDENVDGRPHFAQLVDRGSVGLGAIIAGDRKLRPAEFVKLVLRISFSPGSSPGPFTPLSPGRTVPECALI